MCPFFSKKEEDWLLPEDQREMLKQIFSRLDKDVSILLFIHKGINDPYCEFAQKFTQDLARLEPKLKVQFFIDDEKAEKQYQVDAFPSLLIAPDKYKIRFTGAPAGEEGQAFLQALLLASNGQSGLKTHSREVLAELKEERHIQVFASPSCPYCPGQVINAVRAAIEKPMLISAECVETSENQELAEKMGVGSVPHTAFSPDFFSVGLQPEEVFISELVSLQSAEELMPEQGHEHPEIKTVDVMIIGGGPAGLSAGIYARRAGLQAIILEKAVVGGQVTVTPIIENYPGFKSVGGRQLAEMLHEQAKDYVDIHEGEEALEIKLGKNVEIATNKAYYIARAVILATGATWKSLGVPGEQTLGGQGVSYCASCDGYLYRDKEVVIVGGGNTALTDALHLKNLGVKVTIIHRRDKFRAEQHLQDSVAREEIPVLWDSILKEIKGKNHVSSVIVENVQTRENKELPVEGVFMAIGVTPNKELVDHFGLASQKDGYIEVDRFGRTAIPRIYAAGDITGGVQQIVTAVSEGSTAAMSVFEDLTKN